MYLLLKKSQENIEIATIRKQRHRPQPVLKGFHLILKHLLPGIEIREYIWLGRFPRNSLADILGESRHRNASIDGWAKGLMHPALPFAWMALVLNPTTIHHP